MPIPAERGREDSFRLEAFEPAYLALHRDGRLSERAEGARRALESCRLCPRGCGARRLEGETGTCRTARHAVVSRGFPHSGEEGVLRVGPLRLSPDGLARRGVLLRHLVMPSHVEESAAIFEWLAGEVAPDTWVNVTGQYHPAGRVGEPDGQGGVLLPEINRRPRAWEMEAAHEAARRAGRWRLDARREARLAAEGGGVWKGAGR